jgi:hypothetical protein
VTANHPGGPVAGPNDLQNYPALTASSYPGTTFIAGTLDGTPGGGYLIDLYWDASPDPSGHGQGQRYLGSASLTTDAVGNGEFTFDTVNFAGGVFTATATDVSTGDTSEFSADVISATGSPRLVGPITKTGSGFSFNLLLQTNVTYHIQTATNLGAIPIAWVNLSNFLATSSPYQFIDPATNIPIRFYRAISP